RQANGVQREHAQWWKNTAFTCVPRIDKRYHNGGTRVEDLMTPFVDAVVSGETEWDTARNGALEQVKSAATDSAAPTELRRLGRAFDARVTRCIGPKRNYRFRHGNSSPIQR